MAGEAAADDSQGASEQVSQDSAESAAVSDNGGIAAETARVEPPRAEGLDPIEPGVPVPISRQEFLASSPPILEGEGLCIRIAARSLLESAALELRRGELVLLVGPSGAGKSVLLKVLTGLIRAGHPSLEIHGRVSIGGDVLMGGSQTNPSAALAHTGLVFQNHALFDELDVEGNLAFARDHSLSPRAGEAMKQALRFLQKAGISADREIQELSGGQRQRVAIARCLCSDPEVLIFDEPTSALDPRSSRDVAELIQKTTIDFHKTSLIVTHDYEPFEGIVDRVLFLNPESLKLEGIPFAELGRVMSEARVPEAVPTARRRAKLADLPKSAGLALVNLFDQTPLWIWAIVSHLRFLVPLKASWSWFARFSAHYARLIFWGSAIPYMAISGTIVGFVVTYFTFNRIPHGKHFQDEVLPVLGLALWRVVIPVLTTLLVAGRTGAALASDLGNRVLGHQVEAIRTFGVDERPYLLTAILWMNALGTIFLNLVGFVAASFTSLIVFALSESENTPFFWSTHYFSRLRPLPGSFLPEKTSFVFAKLLAASLVITAISYAVGRERKRSGAEVSFGTTRTVYWATVGVLLVHFAFAFAEFKTPDF